jgi:DNA primase
LAWDELSEGIRASHFTVDNLRQRLNVMKDDPWAELLTLRQTLPSAKKTKTRSKA